jgi:DNA-directed RNA polymerase subunit N (RpoN/RPB10)
MMRSFDGFVGNFSCGDEFESRFESYGTRVRVRNEGARIAE